MSGSHFLRLSSPQLIPNFYPHQQIPPTSFFGYSSISTNRRSPGLLSAQHPLAVIETGEKVDNQQRRVEEEKPRIRWGSGDDTDVELTEQQKHAISQLPFKMSKRCKAFMRRIICFPSAAGEDGEEEDGEEEEGEEEEGEGKLSMLLRSWVKAMKPIRADWLRVLKEMKTINSPHLLAVMEFALTQDSFEANIRDYTKLIDAYAKQNRPDDAIKAYTTMKSNGIVPDQITSTVLIHMYSKSGDLTQAKSTFEDTKLGILNNSTPLDRRTYDSMIMAYIRAGMPEHAETLLHEMDASQIYAGKEVYKALLRVFSNAGNTSGAQRVFDLIQFAGIVPDAKLCGLMLNAYVVAGQVGDARAVFENMRKAGVRPSEKCVALMLEGYEKVNRLDEAMSLLVELESDRVVIGVEAKTILAKWFDRLGLGSEFSHNLVAFPV